MAPLTKVDLSSRLTSERFRHQRPKSFWLALFAGSIGLHLGAGLLAPLWWPSSSGESAAGGTSAPVPIDLIDASELSGVALDDAGAIADPSVIGGPPAVGDPAAIASAPTPPAQPPVSDVVPTEPQGVPEPALAPSDPTFADTAPVAPQPSEFPDQPPPENVQPENVQPGSVNPPQAAQPNPAPTQDAQPNPTVPPTFPGVSDPPYVVGRPLPSPGEPPNPEDSYEESGLPQGDGWGNPGEGDGPPSDGLPGYDTPQQGQPSRGIAQLTPETTLPDDASADIPEIAPQPQQTSLDFTSDPTDPNSCVITPESVPSFGESISFRLVISAEGTVLEAFDEAVSANQAYNDLARCVVRQWTFEPASTAGIPQQSNLVVTVNLQSAQ